MSGAERWTKGDEKQEGVKLARPPDYRKYRLSGKEWLRFFDHRNSGKRALCLYLLPKSGCIFSVSACSFFIIPFIEKRPEKRADPSADPSV